MPARATPTANGLDHFQSGAHSSVLNGITARLNAPRAREIPVWAKAKLIWAAPRKSPIIVSTIASAASEALTPGPTDGLALVASFSIKPVYPRGTCKSTFVTAKEIVPAVQKR